MVDKPTGAQFHVFHRTWWKRNRIWPRGLEPHAGKKHTIAYAISEAEARTLCRVWCEAHNAGELSDKAEYESI